MDKQGPSIGRIAAMGIFTLGCFGLLLFLWLAFDSLDFMEERPVVARHYAFLVTEEEFDAVHERIVAAGLTYWADPFHRREGEINRADGGRGLYWLDPNGHSLEVLTVPYGGWPAERA